MMYKLVLTKSYEKRLKRFLKRHPEVKKQYIKTIQVIEINPFHPSLRIHRLTGRLKDLHSISINMSYRISIEDKKIIPVDIGTHDEVYGG